MCSPAALPRDLVNYASTASINQYRICRCTLSNTKKRASLINISYTQRYDSSLAALFKTSCQSRASFVSVLLRAMINTSQKDAAVITTAS